MSDEKTKVKEKTPEEIKREVKQKTLTDLDHVIAAVEHGYVFGSKMPHNLIVVSSKAYNEENGVKVGKK